MSNINEVAAALKVLEGKTLILTHHNADIDAVGSALALQAGLEKIGIKTDVAAAESISKPAQKLAQGENFIIDPDCAQYENVVLVETSVPEQLASVKNLRADIIIDHHPAGSLAAQAKIVYIDEEAKSTAQIVYKILKNLSVEIDKKFATAIACGIVADTAHLRIAEIEEFETLIELLKTGIKFEDILKLIETPSDASEHTACLKAAMRMEVWKIGDLLLAISRVVSHEAAAARALLRLGADIAVVVAEKENEVRISSRGKNWILERGINLSEIFKDVGKIIGGSGGGHDLAGSANGPDKNQINKAVLHVVHSIENKIGKQGKRVE